jgi:deoxyadenosine/deoxycytidine kinase
MEPIIISIDGNIGAGKSTILKRLKEEHPEFHYIDEPVNLWTSLEDENNESLLKLYYKDKKRWSFTFQNYVLISRMLYTIDKIESWKKECEKDKSKLKNNVFITERFIDTDFNIFTKMLFDDGFINKMEWDIYNNWYNFLTNKYKLNYVIYLNISPETCKERINKRARDGEENITLEFLEKIDSYHQKWFKETNINVLKIEKYDEIFNVINATSEL